MRDKDLYAQILGIQNPWQVTHVDLVPSEGEVTVHVEVKAGAPHNCPRCGNVSPGYDTRPVAGAIWIPASTKPLFRLMFPV